MIVRRSFHEVKPGKGNMSKALDLIKELAALRKYPMRAYTSLAGPNFGTLCIEMEAESMAEIEQASARFEASTEGQAWFERWYEVTVSSAGHAELWTLR
jgi:hypothetical protein